ncbi:MAG TPA: membrane protein insertion efficiency factor YidD [Candidatus Omnitrophota bacterium]|nr:membrane protein insertion efficiency factor YidD [Candidatus Omnitrophota bacterium]HPS36583.1 membrane protein insertion efficiency factor YidD [Candidatus Omnitrophota bacterium]
MKHLLLLFIRFYRACLAPLAGPCCRFSPSCSVYAEEAIQQRGSFAGGWLAVKRLFKCHPFHPGGYDPVN